MASRLPSLLRPLRPLSQRPLTTIAWATNRASASSHGEPSAVTSASPLSRPSHLVMSVAGKDRAGIVKTVTSAVAGHDANVEESRMATLGGDFAMIVYISAPPSSSPDALAEKLRSELPSFSISVRETTPPSSESTPTNVWSFSLEGPDQPGIVAAVSQALATNGCNVHEMQTETSSAPFAGGELFKMNGMVSLDEMKMEQLSSALNDVENRFGMTIVLNQESS